MSEDKTAGIDEEDEFEEMDRSFTVLFSFVRHNRYEAVESMLAQDSELLQVKDETGNGLLHIAAQNGHSGVVEMLLKSPSLVAVHLLQLDEEAAIRTNTTICLGKIAVHLDASERERVLIPAFTRSLKSSFCCSLSCRSSRMSSSSSSFGSGSSSFGSSST